MKGKQELKDYLALEKFCQNIKPSILKGDVQCYQEVLELLKKYPDAPQPQNLLGIIAEVSDNKILAMKHYRAAWSLLPCYRPSRENIGRLVEFEASHSYYFDDEDVNEESC